MKKLNAKSIVLIVIICLIAILLLSLVLISNLGKAKEQLTTTTTTTTTEKVYEEISFTDESTNINLIIKSSEVINSESKLIIEKLDNISGFKDLIALYDIKFIDIENNPVEVKDSEISISIPYENKLNYKGFNVLYLNEKNEVLEIILATYENGFIKFKTNHLSKYAIQGIKDEEETTTTTTTTTKKAETTTTKKNETTTKTTSTTKTTTKTTTTKKTTTTPTTKPIEKTYVVEVSAIDSYSPDRILSVYENGTQISVSEIKYNGSTLCKGSNMVVNMFEIDGISSVTVILKDGTSVTATVQ